MDVDGSLSRADPELLPHWLYSGSRFARNRAAKPRISSINGLLIIC